MEDSATLTLALDPRPLILIQELAHRGHGHLVILLSNVSVIAPRDDVDWTSTGFVLLSRGELMSWVSQGNRDRYRKRTCILHPHVQTLSQLTRWGFNESFPVYLPRESSVLFAKCVIDVQVSITVHTEFHSVGHRSSCNYHSMNQEKLAPVFLLYFGAYFAILCIWGLVRNPKKQYMLRIHSLMSTLIPIKSLDLIFAVMKMDSQPHDFYQLSRAIHNLLFYIIAALIGVSLWKSIPSLHQRVRTVTLITISLQIFADVVLFVINGHRAQSIRDFKKWNSIFLAMNIMSFLTVMTLVVWSIQLQEGASEADEKKASSNNSSELRKLMGMYITAMGYLHFLHTSLQKLAGGRS